MGRAVKFGGGWGALVSGASSPQVDEVAWLYLRTMCRWQRVVVTAVVDGRPGHWRVRQAVPRRRREEAAAAVSARSGRRRLLRRVALPGVRGAWGAGHRR